MIKSAILAKELDALKLTWLEESVLMRMAMSCNSSGIISKESLLINLFPGRTSLSYYRLEQIIKKFQDHGIIKCLQKDGKAFFQIVLDSKDNELEKSFDEFWRLYPKHAAKKDALRAWQKLKPSKELTNTIIDAVQRFSQTPQWKRDGGAYIPNASTFLNGERWKDEIREAVREDKSKRASGWDFPERSYTDEDLYSIITNSMKDLGI